MVEAPAWYRWQGDTLVIQIWAQPNAKRTEIVGLHGDSLRVRVNAVPEGGRANKEITALLAAELGIAPSQLTLVRGAAQRRKLFHARGVSDHPPLLSLQARA